MHWFSAVWFILACYGMANALAVLHFGAQFRSIMSRLSSWTGAMAQCPSCLSFWIGMGISVVAISPSSQFIRSSAVSAFIDGLVASAASWIIHIVTERIFPPHLEMQRHAAKLGPPP